MHTLTVETGHTSMPVKGTKANTPATVPSQRHEAKADRRRVRNLIKLYVSRLEKLQKTPWLVCEYAAAKWDHRDAAKQFYLQTGCNPDSAAKFFRQVSQRAEAEGWKLTPRVWMMYFAPRPKLPA